MTGIFGRKLREKLSSIFADCEMSKLQVDLSTSTASLTDVRLADNILQIISEELSCHVPLVATDITVGRASVSLGLFQFSLETPRLELDNVEVRLRTQPAALWDATAAQHNFHSTKLRAASVHTRMVRLGHEEGDGFVHAVVAQVLDRLEMCIRGFQLSVFDDSSLRIGDMGKPFTMGAGFAQAELLVADGNSHQTSIFRRMSIQEPSAYVDMASLTVADKAEGLDKSKEPDMVSELSIAAESRPGREQDAPSENVGASTPHVSPRVPSVPSKTFERHWLLAPSGEVRCELGLLQCWQPATAKLRSAGGGAVAESTGSGMRSSVFRWAGSLVDSSSTVGNTHLRGESRSSEPLVSEADIAELGIPTHGVGSLKDPGRSTAEMYLPRSAAFAGLQNVRLTVTPRHLEAFLGFVAFAVLGYGAVLQGIFSSGGVPGEEEVTAYCANWLKTVALDAVGPALEEALKTFENAYSLQVIMMARIRALDSVSVGGVLGGGFGGSRSASGADEFPAPEADGSAGLIGVLWRSFTNIRSQKCCTVPECHQHLDGGGSSEGRRHSPRLMTSSLFDTQLTNWEDIVRVARTTLDRRHPGWRSRYRELASSECAVFLAGMRCRQVRVDFDIAALLSHHPENEKLSLSMEEIAFSAGVKRQLDFQAQMSIFGVRLIDEFGPAELRRIERKMLRPMIMPTARSLVWTGNAESELYMFLGKRGDTRDPLEPGLTLRIMSFGTLNICLPTTQLLVLCLNIFSPDVQFMIGRCFAGAPWKSTAPLSVVRIAERGKEAAKTMWEKSRLGQMESCQLHIDMEPVQLLLPRPDRASRHTTFEDGSEWREAVKICLGHVHAASRLRPRAPLPQEFRARSATPQISKVVQLEGEFFDEYNAQLDGIRAAWYDARDVGKRRQLVAPMSAKVSLFVCHWTRASLPQGKIFYDVANMALELEALDHQAVITAMHELFLVRADVARRAAARALSLMERRMRELAKASPMRRGERTNATKNASGEACENSFDDIKLWDVIVRIDHFQVHTRLSSPTSTKQLRVQLSISCQELIFYTFVDGSISASYSAKGITFGDASQTAWKLYQNIAPPYQNIAPPNLRRGGVEPTPSAPPSRHLTISFELLVPDNWDWEWQFTADVRVRQPAVVVDWKTLQRLAVAFLQGARDSCSYGRETSNANVNDDSARFVTKSVEDIPFVGGVEEIAAMSLLPDRINVFFKLESAEFVVPTVLARGGGDETCPALRARGSFVVDVRDFKVHRRQHHAEFLPLPEVNLNACWRDVVMGFFHLSSVEDLRHKTRFTLSEHLEPCRGRCSIRHTARKEAVVDLRFEPVRIHIVPPTRSLLRGIYSAADTALKGLMDELGDQFETGISCIDGVLTKLLRQEVRGNGVNSGVDPDEATRSANFTIQRMGSTHETPRRSLPHIRNLSGVSPVSSSCRASNTDGGDDMRMVLSKESAAYTTGASPTHRTSYLKRGRSQASDDRADWSQIGYAAWKLNSVRSSATSESVVIQAGASSSQHSLDMITDSGPQGPFPFNSRTTSQTITESSPGFREQATIGGVVWLLPPQTVLKLSIDYLSVGMGEMPGSGQNMHAEAVLEDFHFEGVVMRGNSQMDANWKTFLRTMIRVDAFDALSLQVEPVVEPVEVSWRVAFSASQRVPVGGAKISWMNVNLPLGVFYAARLWLRAEEAYHYTPETPANPTLKLRSPDETPGFETMFEAAYSLRHFATHNNSLKGDVGNVYSESIVNMTGEPLAVRLLDDPLTETRGTSWFIVNADEGNTTDKLRSDHAAAVWTVGVPRLAIRGAVGSVFFDVTLQNALQLTQFEVVHLKHPTTGCALSLLLRAVPLESGHGCCLHISTSVMVRNNTALELVWTTPESNSHAVDHSQLGLDVDEEESLHQAPHQNGVEVRWIDPGAFRLLVRTVSSGDLTRIAPSPVIKRRIQPFRRIPMPISWMVAAHEPVRHGELLVSPGDVPDANGVQQLPARTLTRMGTFDFSQPHRDEEKRLKLGGCLVRLSDPDARPRHLCCSLTVGLLADKAVCLEIVISSCLTIINELPMQIEMEATELGKTTDRTRVEPGGSTRQYIAAEEILLDFELPGSTVSAKVPVNGAEPFWSQVDTSNTTVQVIATPMQHSKQTPLERNNSSTSADSGADSVSSGFSEMATKKLPDLSNVISLRVLYSSAFDSDTAVQRLHKESMGLEMLTSFKPPEWKTYRRALTVSARYWVENRSSVDIWLRPKGRQRKVGQHALLLVPKQERRLLPAHIEKASAMRVSVTPDFPKSRADMFKLRGKHTRGILLECESKEDQKNMYGGTVFLQGVMAMAPMHFRGTKVIQFYDNLIFVNATDLSFSVSTYSLMYMTTHAKALLKRQQMNSTLPRCQSATSLESRTIGDAAQLVGPAEACRIDSRGKTLSFCVAHCAPTEEVDSKPMERNATNFSNWASDFVMSKYLRHGFSVGLDKPFSIKVRLRTQAVEDGNHFQNFQVILKRTKQEVGAIVLIEVCTQPRFLVHNFVNVAAEISQRGVSGAKEVLQPGETVEFVWYDPTGIHELVVKKHELVTDKKTMRRLSTDLFTREARTLTIQPTYNNGLGHEVLNIVYSDAAVLPAMALAMTTISLSTVDVACLFRAEGFGLTLSDNPSTQVLYGVADRFSVSLMAASATHKSSQENPGWKQGSKASELSLPFGLGVFNLAPMDISVQLHNVQVDSHIPGSFFSCMVRPLRGRSHLWRSFDSLHPFELKNKTQVFEARGPLLQVDFWNCRFFGSTMLVGSVCAELDRFVVNVDEALLVGIGAYYCRLATYFRLPPFREEHDAHQGQHLDGVGTKISSSHLGVWERTEVDKPAKFIVEDMMEIRQLTAYISLRLVESANPYVEALQRDELVNVVLGMFTHFYSAALLQPAMLLANSRPFRQTHVYMTVKELGELLQDYIIAPLERRIMMFLFFSFDWLGNPLQLLLGMVAGIRELARQPYTRGLIGVPLGIFVCVCSISGTLLDTLARSMSSTVKLLNRLQRTLSARLGLNRVHTNSVFALFRQPTSAIEGIRMGLLLASRHSNSVPVNVGLVFEWFVSQLMARWWFFPVLFVVSIAILGLNMCLDILQIILLLLHNTLHGVSCHLYRRSAEHVCDLAPLQLFALELPMHLRPMRRPRNNKGSYTALPFDFLTALANARLAEPEEKLMFNCCRSRNRDSDPQFADGGEEAVAAFWCGAHQSQKGLAGILVDTGIHLALLQITNWGDILLDGRPRRPYTKYTWVWRVLRSRIVQMSVIQQHEQHFVLLLETRKQAKRSVRFPTKRIAMRAFEALSPRTAAPSVLPGNLLVADGGMPGVIDERSP